MPYSQGITSEIDMDIVNEILGLQCDLDNANERFGRAFDDEGRAHAQRQIDLRAAALEKAAEGVRFETIPASELRVWACVKHDTTWSPTGWILHRVVKIDRDGGMVRARYQNGGWRDFRPTDIIEVA